MSVEFASLLALLKSYGFTIVREAHSRRNYLELLSHARRLRCPFCGGRSRDAKHLCAGCGAEYDEEIAS